MIKNTLKKIKKHLKKRKHKIGYTTSAILFFGLGTLLAQNEMLPPGRENFEPPQEEEMTAMEDFVDPREVENTLRTIGQLKGEVNGLLKRAGKAPDIKAGLTSILAELDTYAKNLKNPPADYTTREALQEFYDARMWEEVGKFRAQIELPRILKEMPVQLRRVEQLLKLKAYQKIGIDTTSLKNSIQEMREAYTSAQNYYKEGNFEEAMQALESMNESGHPGEIEGAIRQLREFNGRIRAVKDKEIKAELLDLLVPVTEAINEGDFRFANELLHDARPQIMMILKQIYKMNAKTRANILKQLSSFEDTITGRLETHEDQKVKRDEDQTNWEEQKQDGEAAREERNGIKEEMMRKKEMEKREQMKREQFPKEGMMQGLPQEFGEKKEVPPQNMPPFGQENNGGTSPSGSFGTTAPYYEEMRPTVEQTQNQHLQPPAGSSSPEPYKSPPANTAVQ